MRRCLQLMAVALLLGVSACTSTVQSADAGPEPDRVPVVLVTDNGDVTIMAEIADSPSERQRGLMFREHMEPDHGMLFLFPNSSQRSFWMKNTLIPLDMVFIRADHTILGIVADTVPKTLTGRSVPGISQFVLELNAGRAAELGLAAEQEVRFVVPLPTN